MDQNLQRGSPSYSTGEVVTYTLSIASRIFLFRNINLSGGITYAPIWVLLFALNRKGGGPGSFCAHPMLLAGGGCTHISNWSEIISDKISITFEINSRLIGVLMESACNQCLVINKIH